MPYLTVKEAARELRVTTRSVYQWLRDGKLRGERAGNLWRISQAPTPARSHREKGGIS